MVAVMVVVAVQYAVDQQMLVAGLSVKYGYHLCIRLIVYPFGV